MEELTWYKAMLPYIDNITVIDGKTQLCKGHV